MEYEHLGNLSKFRAVRDIDVKIAKDYNQRQLSCIATIEENNRELPQDNQTNCVV